MLGDFRRVVGELICEQFALYIDWEYLMPVEFSLRLKN